MYQNPAARTYLIIGALPSSLVNFRGDLIARLVESGGKVVAMAGYADQAAAERVRALGATFIPFPVDRRGRNPFSDVRTFLSLVRTMRLVKPDAILCYTIKPILYGSMAARLIPSAQLVVLVEGLGYAFQGGDLPRRLLGSIVRNLYRLSLNRARYVVFLNSENRETFIKWRLIEQAQAVEVAGIGVNLAKFRFSRPPPPPLRFLMVSRLLKEKGIREYALASALVIKQYPEVEFLLAGPLDTSSDQISLAEIERLAGIGTIKYVGAVEDVAGLLSSAHVLILPSYHEGRSRTVQEALAVGRPVITSDAVGCRDSILDGITGFVVGVRNVAALAERMCWFVENPNSMSHMPEACRRQAEQMYDSEEINSRLVGLLNDRLMASQSAKAYNG